MSAKAAKGSKPIYLLLAFRVIAAILIAALFFTNLPNRLTYPKLHWDKAKQYGEAFGIDPYLIMALIKVESNFRSAAKSKSGAIGLMQVMPDTGKWVAETLGTGNYYDNMLLDSDFNIMIGSYYISYSAGRLRTAGSCDCRLQCRDGECRRLDRRQYLVRRGGQFVRHTLRGDPGIR